MASTVDVHRRVLCLLAICLALMGAGVVLIGIWGTSRDAPLAIRHPEALFLPRTTSPEGHVLRDRGSEKTALNESTGGQYAPWPANGFRNARCDPAPVSVDLGSPGRNSWHAPTLGASASFEPAEADAGGIVPIPETPRGAWDTRSAVVGARSGASFVAGHVNHRSGDLSPWGRLHRLERCAPLVAAGPDGVAHLYRVTDLFVVPQEELRRHDDLLDPNGPARLNLVTCSGPEVRGTRAGLFDYRDNLVVGAALVA